MKKALDQGFVFKLFRIETYGAPKKSEPRTGSRFVVTTSFGGQDTVSEVESLNFFAKLDESLHRSLVDEKVDGYG